ncbi:ribonuclease Z [Acinetobacter defluvii]|uniref:ribonuclease Z n=1 Tax=Acinetobacter defluvii TaxID=1871111 RepID=UPI003AF48863
MLQFTFLGTSSGVPSLTRNVSDLAVRHSKNKDWILIDAGEGTQHRIQQTNLTLQNLKAICITHVHGDHCYGLLGLLASAGMNGRKDALTLIAPKEIQAWLASSMQLTELYLPYEINFIDVTTIKDKVQINNELSISAHALHHRVASYAFAIEVTQQQKKLNVEALNALSISKGKLWGDLQQGKNIEWNGDILQSQDFVEINTQQVKAIVSGDNDQPELLHQACENADLLIHESTYTQETLEKVGASPMHSSAKMLAEFAESVKLPYLILTHFSPRYHDAKGIALLEQEAKQSYTGQLFMAEDLKVFELDAVKTLSKISTPE